MAEHQRLGSGIIGSGEGRTLAFPPAGLEKFVPAVARGAWHPQGPPAH